VQHEQVDDYKRLAGARAAELVEDGMRVGLGTGSTAAHFVTALGARIAQGLRMTAVASSERTRKLAVDCGLTLVELDAPLDFAADGADVIERASLAAIKGLGGALVREKLIAEHATQFVLIADHSKLYDRLSASQPRVPVPVEVVPFGWPLTRSALSSYGEPILRCSSAQQPFVTDNGNFVLDLFNADYSDPQRLAAALKALHGVVGHGLFLGTASQAIVAGPAGVELLYRSA
jgi:ribose 5-phosphate isomerase A